MSHPTTYYTTSSVYKKCRLLQAGQELDDTTHMEHIQFCTLELTGRAGPYQNSMTSSQVGQFPFSLT